jgi:oligopeptide/dipeptide ABC transporter ATP-binding protein
MHLLTVESIKKYFPINTGFGTATRQLKAVDGVSFAIDKNSVFAIVGESGCGKSTVARLVLKLMSASSGRIFFNGQDISEIKGDSLKAFRKAVQIVFQDPFSSLNPRMTIAESLAEPFKIHRIAPNSEIAGRTEELLKKVGLTPDSLKRYPHEFSGGQRQRICIARALAVSPELIVADEPLSALDVSVSAQILNLLRQIKNDFSVTMLFISHDLNVVHYFSDEVAVMYMGRIVEMAKTEDLFESPKHPYTDLLLSSAPKIRVKGQESRVKSEESGDVPSPIDIPSGCTFHTRCPKKMDICDKTVPELKESGGRLVACHLY